MISRSHRKSRRGRALVVLAAVAPVAPFVAIAPASAKTTTLTAHGSVRCAVTGKAKFKPKIVALPTPNTVATVKAKLTCSVGTTGNPFVQVTSGALTVSTPKFTASCLAAAPPSINATIKWKATGGKVNPTKITWSSVKDAFNPTLVEALPAPFGTSSISGSFSGEQAVMRVVSNLTLAGCSSGKGLKGYSYANGSLLRIGPATPVYIDTSPNPTVYSETFDPDALIPKSASGPTPTGSVQYVVDGVPSAPVPVGPFNLVYATADAALPFLTAGTHSIVARYSGDPNFLPGKGQISQVVTPVGTGLDFIGPLGDDDHMWLLVDPDYVDDVPPVGPTGGVGGFVTCGPFTVNYSSLIIDSPSPGSRGIDLGFTAADWVSCPTLAWGFIYSGDANHQPTVDEFP